MQVRAIHGARVSVYKSDAKTSHITQHEAGAKYAKGKAWEVVGTFEDLGVSAGRYSPWERPGLGVWLDPMRLHEWDAIIFYSLDRAFRSYKDAVDFMHMAKTHKKIIVFTDNDQVYLDWFTGSQSQNIMNDLVLIIMAMGAEMELNKMRSRATEAHKYLRPTTRFAGGKPHYGYKVIDNPMGNGKTLAINPYAAGIIQRMAAEIINGASIWSVAQGLNTDGVLPPRRYLRSTVPSADRPELKEGFGALWQAYVVRNILTSPAIMGFKIEGQKDDRRAVRDETGMPIRLCEPLLSEEDWNLLQTKIQERGVTRERVSDSSPYLGVAYCEGCKRRAYRKYSSGYKPGERLHYYRCIRTPDWPKPCPKHSTREERLREFLDENIAVDLADVPYEKDVFIPGDVVSDELDALQKAIEGMRKSLEKGWVDDDELPEFESQMDALVQRRAEIKATPVKKAQWIKEPTGESVADVYARMDDEERRRLLIKLEIKVFIGQDGYLRLQVPEDLKARAMSYRFPDLDLVTR